jgi:hypothetical protein
LHTFYVAYGAHPSDGYDCFGVGFDATLGHYVSE